MYIDVETFADAYKQVRVLLLDAPIVCPKGEETKELLHVTVHIKNPRARLAYHPERKLSLPFILAESILLFDENDSLDVIKFYNGRMVRWSDDGKTMYGSYGKRISSYLPSVVKKLQGDKESRQAVLNIYQRDDMLSRSRDIPCTVAVQFLIREERLHCMVTMRSQDVIWGFFNDVPTFTIVQEVLANELGVGLGEYWHTAHSFHVYKPFYDLLEQIECMKSVEFSIPYMIDDMRDLAYYVKHSKQMQRMIERLREEHEGPFAKILLYELLRRQKMDRTIDVEWARPFLEDRDDK